MLLLALGVTKLAGRGIRRQDDDDDDMDRWMVGVIVGMTKAVALYENVSGCFWPKRRAVSERRVTNVQTEEKNEDKQDKTTTRRRRRPRQLTTIMLGSVMMTTTMMMVVGSFFFGVCVCVFSHTLFNGASLVAVCPVSSQGKRQ